MKKALSKQVVDAIEDLKGQDVLTLDVTTLSDVMDTLVIATGTSSRHVKALASNVIDELKKKDIRPIGIEGLDASDWVLVDFGSTVVHIMLEQARIFYDLEKLWTPLPKQSGRASD